jgi:hypothetical protein
MQSVTAQHSRQVSILVGRYVGRYTGSRESGTLWPTCRRWPLQNKALEWWWMLLPGPPISFRSSGGQIQKAGRVVPISRRISTANFFALPFANMQIECSM